MYIKNKNKVFIKKTPTQSKIPTEDQEGTKLAKWLREHNYKFTHIGNESGLRGTKGIIIMMAKKKRLGVSKGFPDYYIISKNKKNIYIELKRQRKIKKNGELGASPSKISPEQIEWIKELKKVKNNYPTICYGAEESIEYILKIENFNK